MSMWQIRSNQYRSAAFHIKELAECAMRGAIPFGVVQPADKDNEPCFTMEHEKELYKLIFEKNDK